MRASTFIVGLAMWGGALMAEEAGQQLANRYLKIAAPSEGSLLLERFGAKGSSVNHLEEGGEAAGLLAGIGGGQESEGGLQATLWKGDGSAERLTWRLEEANAKSLRYVDQARRFRVVMELPEEARFLEITITPLANAKADESLELKWALCVGGDFMAVTTEGVADQDLTPRLGEGGGFLHRADIEREEDATFPLAQPWFAVADKNQAVSLVIWFQATEMPVLHQWSGRRISSEVMSRALRFAPLTSPLRLRMMLFDGRSDLSTVLEDGAIHHDAAKASLTFAPAKTIQTGELRLIARLDDGSEKELIRQQIEQWTPDGERVFSHPPLKAPLKVGYTANETLLEVDLLEPKP